jgi:hypothetical protein
MAIDKLIIYDYTSDKYFFYILVIIKKETDEDIVIERILKRIFAKT